MTPRETLAKYGLATDVKSIINRLNNDDIANAVMAHNKGLYSLHERLHEHKTLYQADLVLLCEMAEKVEKIQESIQNPQNWNVYGLLNKIKSILDGEQ